MSRLAGAQRRLAAWVGSARATRLLLTGGRIAGPVFVMVTVIEAGTREGFDIRRHGISLLSLGERGWIQVANFIVTGLVSIAFAVGARRLWQGRSGRRAIPALIAGYGAGLILTGVFLVDPGEGFPPGVTAGELLSWHGAVHAAAPPLAFGCVVALTVLFARRYAQRDRRRRAALSLAAGVGIAALVAWPAGGGSVRSALAVAVASAWMSAMASDLGREVSR